MGGWTAVAALYSLEVEHSTDSGLLGKTLYTPSVSGIVDVLHVDIGADDSAKASRSRLCARPELAAVLQTPLTSSRLRLKRASFPFRSQTKICFLFLLFTKSFSNWCRLVWSCIV